MNGLSPEQTIRLAVLNALPPGLSATQKASDIEKLSAVIIGTVAAVAAPDALPVVIEKATTVVYEGTTYTSIPRWANYIAGDYDGAVYVYEHQPTDATVRWAGGGQWEMAIGPRLSSLEEGVIRPLMHLTT